MADDITMLQRQVADLRCERDAALESARLLRVELADLRPKVSNQAHTIARLTRELNELRPKQLAAPDTEPLPTDPAPSAEPAAAAATDRFHNGG